MTILCQLLGAVLLVLAGLMIWRERVYQAEREKHHLVVADLLDRVMARSYGEYVSTRPSPSARPLRRRALTDGEMAEIEQKMLADKAAS